MDWRWKAGHGNLLIKAFFLSKRSVHKNVLLI